MAARGETGTSGRKPPASKNVSAAVPPPWERALCSLQRNAEQFSHNLARLQQHVGDQLAQLQQPTRRRRRHGMAALPMASVSQATEAAAPRATPAAGGGVSKEEIGRATWTFLHTLAAQYPEQPTRRQRNDAKALVRAGPARRDAAVSACNPSCASRLTPPLPLCTAPCQIDILTRMYPCGECARHFRELVAASPPTVRSRADFSRWMCEAHNTVNRRLGKPTFNCALVEARWAGIECEGDEAAGGGCKMAW